jgi:uncharacterized membrane protein
MITILLLFFFLLFPLVIIYLCRKWSLLAKLGTIVLAYGIGLMIGSAGIIPRGSENYRAELQGKPALESKVMESLISEGKIQESDRLPNSIFSMQDTLYSVSILLAFPLILFSLNLRRWINYARKGFLSVALALISGLVMVTAGFFIWKESFPDTWKLAGMFEGIYTGGTPNFAALKLVLDVDTERFLVLNTYDMVVGAFLVLFFVSVAPRLFRAILPKFVYSNERSADVEKMALEAESLEDFSGMLNRKRIIPLLKAMALSVFIVGIGVGLGFLVPQDFQQYRMAVIVLSITTLGVLASLIKSVNIIEKTFQLGLYFILVFSLTVASMADLKTIFQPNMSDLILFITWCYFGSMLLHLALAWIFRIDADNFLITATAFVFSPPFVPLVANALKNRDVIITGIAGGVLGYILGNYFGATLAYILKSL